MGADHTGRRPFIASATAYVAAIFDIDSSEIRLTFLAFLYFFLLLCGYFIIRPIRDNMGIEFGAARLPYLFIAIFLVMLAAAPVYGWLVSRFAKGRIVPIAYGCFGLQIVAFYLLLRSPIERVQIAPFFFVWVSVYNLFVVSIFWSYMVDIFTSEQAKRLFGFIAAGGTAGAMVGPLITQALVTRAGTANLLPVSLAFLMAATACVLLINHTIRGMPSMVSPDQPIGHSVLSGFQSLVHSRYLASIAAWVVFGSVMGSTLYLEQQNIVAHSMTSPDARVQLFARMDFAVSILTILLQVLAAEKVIRYFGVGWAVAAQSMATIIAFVALVFAPLLPVIVVAQVVSRGCSFGLSNPARHILFSVVSLDEKYKAQNVIDTVVQRTGDATGSSVFAALSTGLGLSPIAAIAMPIAAVWFALSIGLGRMHKKVSG
jgi:ATP:ADP antiporter, AAA family